MDQKPDPAYAAIIAVYLALFGLIAAMLGRKPEALRKAPPARDLAMLGVATYRLSRLISYDRVTSILREPFVESGVGYEQIEGTQEEPKGRGLQRSLGQLLNCSWCVSVWAGTFNTTLYTFFPRIGRLFLMSLMASGISELLDPLFPLFNYLAGFVQQKEAALKERSES